MRGADLKERFWAKVKIGAPDECWEWQASRNSQGYGGIRWNGKVRKAHRISAMLHGLEIAGKVIMHTCDNPPCCNPLHLVSGTREENMADMAAKGRSRNSRATRTHCPKGHEYAGDNLYIRRDGGTRQCRECNRLKNRSPTATTRRRRFRKIMRVGESRV